MKPKSITSRRQTPLPKFLILTLTLGTTGILFLDSAQAQSTRTWDGGTGGTGTLLNTNTNWSADTLPVSGDTAQWNGTVAGNLVLDYTVAFVNATNGVSIDITSAQTGSLTIGTSNGSSMSVQNIAIGSGAGAFTYGDGTGPESFGFRGASNTFTNSDNDTATFASGINFFSGGGNNRTVVFAGTGNWAVNSAFSTTTGIVSVTKQDAGTLTLSGANAYRGVTTISGGTLSVSSIANGGATGPALTTTVGSATVTTTSTTGLAVGQTVISQRIPLGTTIASIDSATQFTLSSGTGVTAGSGTGSAVGTANGLGISSNAATNLVFDGGTLQYTGNTAISDRAFTINAGKTATIEVTTANQSLTLAGATGTATTGALTKTGVGTLTLSATNTYTGATNVNQGKLVMGDGVGDTFATSGVTVASGAALGGSGTITNTVGVTGILAPGIAGVSDGIGTLNAGTTTWNGAASGAAATIWQFDLGASTSDMLNITGDFIKNTTAGTTFRFDFMGSTPTWGTTYTLVDWSTGTTAFTGSDFSFTGLSSFWSPSTFNVDTTNRLLTFTAVPEPTSALAGLLITAGLLRRRRKF